MFFRSERLFLRPAWPEDAQDLHAALADERVVRHLPWAPWPLDIGDAQALAGRHHDARYPEFLITLPGASGARIFGGAALKRGAEAPCRSAEIECWLSPEAWGRGYATEAVRAMLRLARTLGHERVTAQHFLDNPAAGRVLAKVGFRPAAIAAGPRAAAGGGSFPVRRYELRFDGASDCDDPARAMPIDAPRAA